MWSKYFGRVQNFLDVSKKFECGEHVQNFQTHQKFFEHVQYQFKHIKNFLNMFKKFWTEQMDRALVSISVKLKSVN